MPDIFFNVQSIPKTKDRTDIKDQLSSVNVNTQTGKHTVLHSQLKTHTHSTSAVTIYQNQFCQCGDFLLGCVSFLQGG